MKEKIAATIEKNIESLFAMACDIFDHPETGLEEVYASTLLTNYLEEKGFTVERGIAGMSTAFRATWERGSGGPAIGFLLEYDALKIMGHACSHHMQGPACIGAALALMENCDQPFKLVLYGTPDEEVNGGKLIMEKAGCFRDVDVMFAYHTSGETGVTYTSKALASQIVTFHGTPSHASASPEKGRSALDAMLLTFQGIEFMREHVKDGSRMQYTVLESTGATNIVHETAKARITVRSHDRFYMKEMLDRVENIIKGACLMTDTSYESEKMNEYWNIVPVASLRETVYGVEEEIGAEKIYITSTPGVGGSTDVGNVSWVVPTANIYAYFTEGGAHSDQWLADGKSEKAKNSIVSAMKILSLSAMKIIESPELLAEIQAEHKAAIAKPE